TVGSRCRRESAVVHPGIGPVRVAGPPAHPRYAVEFLFDRCAWQLSAGSGGRRLAAAVSCLDAGLLDGHGARSARQGPDRGADSGRHAVRVHAVAAGLAAVAAAESALGIAAVRRRGLTLVRAGGACRSAVPGFLLRPRTLPALPHAD